MKAKRGGSWVTCFYMWGQFWFRMSSAAFSWRKSLKLLHAAHSDCASSGSGEVSLDICAAAQVITRMLVEGFRSTWSIFLPDPVGPVSAGAPVVLSCAPGQHKHPQCESSQVRSFTFQHLLHCYLSTLTGRWTHTCTFIHFHQSSPLILSRLVCITSWPLTGRGQTTFAVPWKCCFPRAEMGKDSWWARDGGWLSTTRVV